MDRKDLILAGLNLEKLQGLEIGALSKPLVTSNEGRIHYVDHLSTKDLRSKYGVNEFYELGDMIEVDTVWNSGSLREAIGDEFHADYIVASHVIEHVPDLVEWLGSLSSVLSPGGDLRLAVPDKRFIFDHHRDVSRTSDVLAAHIRGEKVPGPQAVIDYELNAINADILAIWRGEAAAQPSDDPNWLRAVYEKARAAYEKSTYLDAHCWVFTPKAFARIMRQLSILGLIDFQCTRFLPTMRNGLEFYVSMTKISDQTKNTQSWEFAHSLAVSMENG